MASIASLDFLLNMNTVNWNAGLTQAEARTQRFRQRTSAQLTQVRRSFAGLRTAVIAAFAVFGGGQVLTAIDELSTLADQSDITFARFQQLAVAFDQNGIALTQFANLVRGLGTRLLQFGQDTGEARTAFMQLGLSFEQLSSLGTEQQLLLIFDRLRTVTNEAERAALAGRIFGEEVGPRLGRALAGTNAELLAAADSFSRVITAQQLDNIRQFQDQMALLRASLQSLVGAISPFLNVLTTLINGFSTLVQIIPGVSQILGFVLFAGVVRLVRGAFAPLQLVLRGIANDMTRRNVPAAFAFARTLRQQLNPSAATTSSLMRGILGTSGGVARSFGFVTLATSSLTVAVSGLRAVLAALGGPIGIAIFAFTQLAIVFQDQLISAFRAVGNFFVRVINSIIDRLDRVLRFFGRDGITFRLQEFMSTVQDTAVVLQDFAPIVDDVADSTDGLADSLDNGVDSFTSFMNSANNDFEQFSSLAQTTFNSATDSILNFFETGMLNLRSFVAEFIRGFARIRIQQALLGAFGGGTSNFLSGLSGAPARQFGGPVTAGQAYVVGERGPELFVPNSGGSVVSNSNLGGGGGNVTYNINATDARSFQQLVASDPSFIFNVTERGRRQVGV